MADMSTITPEELAKAHAAEAVGMLVSTMRDTNVKRPDRIKAAAELLDKAASATVQTGSGNEKLRATLNSMRDEELLQIALDYRAERGARVGGPEQNGGPQLPIANGYPTPIPDTSVQTAYGRGTDTPVQTASFTMQPASPPADCIAYDADDDDVSPSFLKFRNRGPIPQRDPSPENFQNDTSKETTATEQDLAAIL